MLPFLTWHCVLIWEWFLRSDQIQHKYVNTRLSVSRALIDEPCPTASTTKDLCNHMQEYTQASHTEWAYTSRHLTDWLACVSAPVAKLERSTVCVRLERVDKSTSVPEALLLALFPSLSHIISVDMTITHRALWHTQDRLGIMSATKLQSPMIKYTVSANKWFPASHLPFPSPRSRTRRSSSCFLCLHCYRLSSCFRTHDVHASRVVKVAWMWNAQLPQSSQVYFPSLCTSHLYSRLYLLLPGECL